MKTLKEKLNAKLSKNGGFTLVEMLIVVAIIAILVAVSIPIVNGALEDAKKATDAANARAAVAAATIQHLDSNGAEIAATKYHASQGKLAGTSDTVTAYGKSKDLTDKIVWVKVSADGVVQWNWAVPGTAPTAWNTGTPMSTEEGIKVAS